MDTVRYSSTPNITQQIEGITSKATQNTKLFVAKYSGNSKSVGKIRRTVSEWKNIAKERYEKANKLNLPEDKINLAGSSFGILNQMEFYFPRGICSYFYTIHVAYDNLSRIQAIAYTVLAGKDRESMHIKFIATNPYNVEIFDHVHEKHVRGAGSTLIKSIALDSLKNNYKKGNVVTAPHTIAVPFYKKMGFIGSTGGEVTPAPSSAFLINQKIKTSLTFGEKVSVGLDYCHNKLHELLRIRF